VKEVREKGLKTPHGVGKSKKGTPGINAIWPASTVIRITTYLSERIQISRRNNGPPPSFRNIRECREKNCEKKGV